MGNLRPFVIFDVALLRLSKFGYFTDKSTKYVVKIYTLALHMTF